MRKLSGTGLFFYFYFLFPSTLFLQRIDNLVYISFILPFVVNISGMPRTPKQIQQAKRVTPPAIPEIYRHSGSSFGSTGYGSGEDATASINSLSTSYLTEPTTPGSLGSDYAITSHQITATSTTMIEGKY